MLGISIPRLSQTWKHLQTTMPSPWCSQYTATALQRQTYRPLPSRVRYACGVGRITVKMVTDQLGLPTIPLVICTDAYSLCECPVKLGTTKEKRRMIDIMALRQSYERHEMTEIRWINGGDDPADAMAKISPNRALERLFDGEGC